MCETQENYEITPCFVHLRRIDDNLINIILKKYGLRVKAVSGDFKKEETHKVESVPLWSDTVSKKKKSLKRKRDDRDDSSSKFQQKHSTSKKTEDSCPSHKYFSNNGTHKLNFSMKKKPYLEHETSCSRKFNQMKKNYLKTDSPIVKILEEKKRSDRNIMREKNKFSKQISQSKVKNMMKELKKLPETQEELANNDAFAHFSEQRPRNVSKTLPIIHTCNNKSNDNNNNGVLVEDGKQLEGVNEECSQLKQVLKSEKKIVAKISQTDKNDELYTVGGGFNSGVCDLNLNSNVENEILKTNNLRLDEDEYDSRGEDSEDDKQTVIFDEKFDTLRKLKESSEKVSEYKQQNIKINIIEGKLISPRTLKRGKPSLVRIIKKKKLVARKKLGKPTRNTVRKASERRQIERSERSRSKKFVEKFEDILGEVSNLVKHLHDTHKIIIHLKKDMEENEKLAEHFKTVIEAQQENYRKEIWRNQETIMKGYDKMMSFCKKSSTVSLEISKRTFLSIEDVENVLSRCILVENALEMLKSTQKLSAVEKNVLEQTGDQGMRACFEKEWPIGTVPASSDSSGIIGKESHGQIIGLDKCQNQRAPEKASRISNNLCSDDSVNPSAKHLALSSSATSIPCSTSTYVLKERQVTPPRQGIGDHSENLVLRKSHSHDSNHLLIPYQSSEKSRVNIINQDYSQGDQRNSALVAGFSSGVRRSDFIQHGKPREEHIQPGDNVQNHLLTRQMKHCLQQQHLTNTLSQFLTGDFEQQIVTTKRPPRPQNPIPRVFQPRVEMNSKRDKQQCHQQPGFLVAPFNPVTTRCSFNQSKSSYIPHSMESNPSMLGPYTPIRGISKLSSSRNNVTSASHSMPSQKVIPRSNNTFPNVSNTSVIPTSTPVRTRTPTVPVLTRQLQNPPTFSQNMNNHRMTCEAQLGLRVSNPVQNIPSSMRTLHPATQSSGFLNVAVTGQRYFSKAKANERALQALRKNKSSDPCGSCIVLKSSTLQKSKSEPELLDPTIPQKLTMKNQRLQAGAILISSGEVAKSQRDEDQMNRAIKIVSRDVQEEEKMPESQEIARRNSSRKYECAQNGCKSSGIRICKGCESVIYCSDTCQDFRTLTKPIQTKPSFTEDAFRWEKKAKHLRQQGLDFKVRMNEFTGEYVEMNFNVDVGENGADVSETVDFSKQDSEEVSEKILRLPVSRVKKIMKIDPDVSLASREAVFLITKATELLLDSLAKEAYAYTAGENKKTVTKKHLDSAISNIDALAFLDGTLD